MRTLTNRGSALDMERAFADKVAELSNLDTGDVIASASNTDVSRGSTADMMFAVNRRIDELSDQSVVSTQDTAIAVDVLGARDPESQDKLERYMHTLIGDLTGILNDGGIYNTIFDYDDTNLYMTVSTEAAPATEYTIPFADLKLDFDQIDADIDYIIDGTVGSKDAGGSEAVTAGSEAVTAGYTVDPGYDFELEQMGEEAAELVQRYMSGKDSPHDVLTDLGYKETEADFYSKSFDKYTRVFDFRYNDNDVQQEDYYCRYYVLEDDMIPVGKQEITLNLYDEALDPNHMVDEVVDETIEGSWDVGGETYTRIASKQVTDSDGFLTDYTWYRSSTGLNVFVFGDNEVYGPEDGDFDWEEENDEAAQAWFDSYTGFDDDDEDPHTLDADDIFSCEEAQQHIQCAAFDRDWYFGKEQADQYGDLIANSLSGKTISKRRDLADAPGGLIYEANQLGIDMWDLLGALEGMCYQNRACEIDDSTYQVL